MPITISVTGEDAASVKAQLSAFFSGVALPQGEAAAEAGKPATGKKTTKKDKAADEPDEELRGLEPNLENCRNLIKKVTATDTTPIGDDGYTVGIKAGHEILQKHGVAKLGDLPAEKYPLFIKDCYIILDKAEKAEKAPAEKPKAKKGAEDLF